MANLTPFAQQTLLGVFRGLDTKLPNGMYVGLIGESPDNPENVREVRGRGYKRQPLTLGAPVNGVCDNPGDISFGIAQGLWGRVVAIGVYDAATVGNLWLLSEMELPQTVDEGSPFKIPAGGLSISLL